jgi:hypothetical protein
MGTPQEVDNRLDNLRDSIVEQTSDFELTDINKTAARIVD